VQGKKFRLTVSKDQSAQQQRQGHQRETVNRKNDGRRGDIRLADAENVRIIVKSLRLYFYEQYFERQERKVRWDVFLGEILYRGDCLKEFLPFLKAGELLNVGADTTHGFGRFVIQK